MLYAGVDMGGSTTKAMIVDEHGNQLVKNLVEVPTGSKNGPAHVIAQMKSAIDGVLAQIGAKWTDVAAVGQATPGPATKGVLERTANLDPSLAGCDVRGGLEALIAKTESHTAPVRWVNDANAGGFADWFAFGEKAKAGVVGLYPGTGLGGAFVSGTGELLEGDNGCGAEIGHLPTPAYLNFPQWKCGCGRYGCFETGASIMGLRNQLAAALSDPQWSSHEFAQDPALRAKDPAAIATAAFSLRKRAQQNDALALALFDQQARVLGAASAVCAIAFDPAVIVFGGGLMESTATTPEFRKRLLTKIRETFDANTFPIQKKITLEITPFGDLSQSLGAALLVRQLHKSHAS